MWAILIAHFYIMEARKKQARYERLYKQISDLVIKHKNPLSTMATINAVLFHKFDHYFWCGFYLLNDGKLQVGPYQGSLACIDLAKNTGVCWAGINSGEAVVVPNVEEFEGHIACDGRSKSEIVIPVRNEKSEIVAVMDVDSAELNSFDEVDAQELSKIVKLIYQSV